MSKNQLFKVHVDSKTLQGLKEINFVDHQFKERYDIQEWVESSPKILGEDLLIIAKEKTFFDGTNERPDLIAIDKNGNTVIIELKRDDSGTEVNWQSIKYAAYWSKFEISHIVEVYKDYLKENGQDNINDDVVNDRLLDFIDEDDLDTLNNNQRIILVSHRFSREVISASNWLIDEYDMDLKCVQLIPFYDEDQNVYNIMSNILLPLPGLDKYLIKPSRKNDSSKENKGSIRKDDSVTKFMEDIQNNIINSDQLKEKPNKNSRWAGVGNYFRYYHFWYTDQYWENWGLSYRILKFDEHSPETSPTAKFGLYLEFDRKGLLNNGLSQKKFDEMKNYLKSIDNENFKYKDLDRHIRFYKIYDNDEINLKMRNQITKDLIEMIELTKKPIDDIIRK